MPASSVATVWAIARPRRTRGARWLRKRVEPRLQRWLIDLQEVAQHLLTRSAVNTDLGHRAVPALEVLGQRLQAVEAAAFQRVRFSRTRHCVRRPRFPVGGGALTVMGRNPSAC